MKTLHVYSDVLYINNLDQCHDVTKVGHMGPKNLKMLFMNGLIFFSHIFHVALPSKHPFNSNIKYNLRLKITAIYTFLPCVSLCLCFGKEWAQKKYLHWAIHSYVKLLP